MNFKHKKNLQESIDGMKKIFGISWSPNLLRLAVAHVDERRLVRVTLFDENGDRREMFQTKPANKNSKSYIVKDIAFSPDSTKLAISQSDCIIFVYSFGQHWGDKKVICNKFEQNFPVTAMVWPNKMNNELFFGTADGKVKKALLKSNSAQGLYSTGSFVVAMSYNMENTNLLSSHMDHSIFCYNIENGNSLKIHTLPTLTYCLSYLVGNQFLTADLQKKVHIHNDTGEVTQTFDYAKKENLKDFSICKANSNFDLIAVGNYNKLFIYGFNTKLIRWEESCVLDIENYYSFTALCWKQDFGVLVTGSLCGSLDMFESCVKKSVVADKFEITYMSLSQIMIKDLEKGRRINIKSTLAPEILKVSVQNNNYIVITTESSLIVGDLNTQKWSEVPWHSTGEEKYDFNNCNTCLVYVNGEIAVIEFSNNEIVGYFRTEFSHPNLVSAKVLSGKNQNVKLIAYLVDTTTIAIQDLNLQNVILTYVNDSKVEYVEFSKSGRKLIFRDGNKNLNMLLLPEGKKIALIPLCYFAQWVPNTEVLVAQNPKNLFVWYNIENYQSPQLVQVKGTVESIERRKGKIEVYIVQENTEESEISQKVYLDENLVNLSLALDERELSKALAILDTMPLTNETKLYWKVLSEIALEERNLQISQRCFASLSNYPKVTYIKALLKKQEKNPKDPLVNARILILEKKYKDAEVLLVQNNMVKEAVELFKEVQRYEDALRLSEEFKLPETELMKKDYLDWLIKSEMFNEAAELKLKDNCFLEAISFYIQGELQVKAANLIMDYKIINVDKGTVDYLVKRINELGIPDVARKLRDFAVENGLQYANVDN